MPPPSARHAFLALEEAGLHSIQRDGIGSPLRWECGLLHSNEPGMDKEAS